MSFHPEDQARIDAALANATVTHDERAREILVDGLPSDGWMLFRYDADGYLTCEDLADTVRFTKEKTGRPTVPWQAVNAAWILAVRSTPLAAGHVMNRYPPGALTPAMAVYNDETRTTERMTGTVLNYAGQWITVRFAVGERSVPISHARDWP